MTALYLRNFEQKAQRCGQLVPCQKNSIIRGFVQHDIMLFPVPTNC